MKKLTSIIATGNVDKHGCILAEEALVDMVEMINSPRKCRVGLEHDILVPPLGWLSEAHLEPHEDTLAVVASQFLYEKSRPVKLPDGTSAIEHYSDDAEFRFVCPDQEQSKEVVLHTDPTSFASFDAHRDFERSLKKPEGLDYKTAGHMRKAHVPDPEVIITLARDLGIVYVLAHGGKSFAESFGAAMGKYSGEKMGAFLDWMKSTFKQFATKISLKNRPTTYVVRIIGEPEIELVARTTDTDKVCKAYCDPQFGDLYADVEKLDAAFGLDFVQFVLADDGSWKFNYMLTKKGTTVGTKEAYDRRAKLLDDLGRKLPGS